MKIALVHDYLTQKGGAERVFELLCEHFPDADLFTSLYAPEHTIDLGDRPVNTTYLQNLPGASHYFRFLAPFYYRAFRALDLTEYDLIISSSTSFAKAVRKRDDAKHICFCHNVTRFLWDTKTYLSGFSGLERFTPLIDRLFEGMRQIDKRYAIEPDLYIANSSTVANRIRDCYGKDAIVINYPIDNKQFIFSEQKDTYSLVSSRMLSYKKIDVTIQAFNELGLPLKIIGDGPERDRLRQLAGPTIEFLGYVSDDERGQLMAQAKYVIVAALEDYGLVPVEANASGTPVISFGEGGVLDTQIPGKTGLFFNPQTAEALVQTLKEAESIAWDPVQIRNHALSNFSQKVFFEKTDQVISEFCQTNRLGVLSY
jgi:glycosyltransferase involved in cell wall biosynthesis